MPICYFLHCYGFTNLYCNFGNCCRNMSVYPCHVRIQVGLLNIAEY